ncbi:MAG: phosphoribosyltransferase [Candidatus Doudnabacteria bacterium]|nr:phosphoribosyltransferase [Candidatus Doudnabacteria bacterium]
MDIQKEVLDILKKTGAVVVDSHFVGTSGRHFAVYINKDALYPHGQETSKIAKIFAGKAKDLGVEVVVGPALGGIILAQWTAHELSAITGIDVMGVYTEKTEGGGQALKRGYDNLVKGKKVLIVEDLTTTGDSAKKVVEAVQAARGLVAAVSVMVNKSPQTVNAEFFGVPFLPLAELPVPNYEAAECPLCKSGVLINTTVGHGKKYLEAKGLLK